MGSRQKTKAWAIQLRMSKGRGKLNPAHWAANGPNGLSGGPTFSRDSLIRPKDLLGSKGLLGLGRADHYSLSTYDNQPFLDPAGLIVVNFLGPPRVDFLLLLDDFAPVSSFGSDGLPWTEIRKQLAAADRTSMKEEELLSWTNVGSRVGPK
ncbi:hypothetical protein CRG98_031002 [Punica granatum]|uniref:Uncharacterized protein n=1 Tax=Punica granatum TaxID=22663 RepID=A0A2I0IXU9_PUNGR|nr:hypothetical protein CRG98_031002 [Punica granatum]